MRGRTKEYGEKIYPFRIDKHQNFVVSLAFYEVPMEHR